jgi:hypothetical protein
MYNCVMTYRGHIKNGVAVLDESVSLPDGTLVSVQVKSVPSGFWRNKTLDELMREQGVKPIQSLDELAGDWPPEDSVDEFLGLVREVRR